MVWKYIAIVVIVFFALLILLYTFNKNNIIENKLVLNGDNGTIFSEQLIVEVVNSKNQTIILEYSLDGNEWKELYKKHEAEGKVSIKLNTTNIEEGEYFLKLSGIETNLSDTKKIIISKKPSFDLQHNFTLENKTLYLIVSPTNITGNISSYSWTFGNQITIEEKIKTPYNNENLTISLLVKNKYNLSNASKIDILDSLVDSIEYCLVKNIQLKTEGEAKYEYKTVTFDFNNTKIFVNPLLKSKPILGKTIKTAGENVALAYSLEVIGSFYGNISRCNSGQLVKGTRTFVEYGKDTEWYDTNYPKKPGPNKECSQNSTVFCNDDYSIHANEKSSVIQADNNTIHWYDIPNLMLPANFLPSTINQTFVSYIKGDNGYCWVKWGLEGKYEKSLQEIIPLHVEEKDRACFVDELPVNKTI